MTITLQVAQQFDSYKVGDQIPLPDAAAQALLNAYPGRYQFGSSTSTTPGTLIVVPVLPNGVITCTGTPDPTLAATYGYALDLTSTPATLYRWTGTAWAVVLQSGVGTGPPAPTLVALTLSTLTGTAGAPFSATLTGTTAGSTITATASDGTVLTLTNGTLSGTFATAGTKSITLVETLAGATGSPRTTTLSVTIAAAAPVLQALGLASLTATAGTSFSTAISGRTAGSTVTATSADGTVLTVSGGNVSGTFASAGTKQVTLAETLAGATGSPKTTTLFVVVAAAPVTPVLQALTLSSTTATVGTTFSAIIAGQTSGSILAATASDGTALTISGSTLSGTFAAAGSPTITLTETLAGATGSPKSTTLTITVSAASAPSVGVADFSDPNNSGIAGAL